MAEEKTMNRREQVAELIKEGTHTKAEIAEMLDVSPASVSSQMTYLRWMGNFIKYDENKVLTFCTEDEYNDWQEELAANRKTKTSARTPEEQAEATYKAIERQETQLSTWQKKLAQIESDIADDPDDAQLDEFKREAEANITLLEIKISRNKVKQEDLPDYEPPAESEETEPPADDDEDLV
jgi:predicted transcriptional regulator